MPSYAVKILKSLGFIIIFIIVTYLLYRGGFYLGNLLQRLMK